MIDVQRQHPAAVAWYASTPPGSLALPGHVLMELYQSAQNQQHTLAVDRLTTSLPLIWPADVECLQAVRNFRLLHLSHGLGLVDALIAATALSLSAPLCTFNLKHFRHIPGLVTEQPYQR
jgi:predicted nucleic acid-binding protein